MNRINMHYCAVRNTRNAMHEVYEDMQDTDVSELSDEERNALRQLVKLCRDFVDEFGEDWDE